MATDGSPVDGAPLHPSEHRLLENYPQLAVILTVVLATVDIYEGDLRQWQWLFISGILVFLVTYPLSLRLPDRVVKALQQLRSQGVLQPEEAVSAFEHRLNRSANQWANFCGFALSAVIGLAWLVAFMGVLQDARYTLGNTIPGAIIEMILAVPAGRFIGRGLCYSTLARRLRAEGITLQPIPEHVDGVAGLRPVGRIYLAQAVLVASIAAFLSVWIILLPVLGPLYAIWRLPYVGLLILVLVIEAVSLLWPLHAFHRALLAWKQEMLRDAPASHARMDEHGIVTSEQRQRLLREHRNRIERMPTWVLDAAARWFLVGVNVLLAAPLLLIAAGLISI